MHQLGQFLALQFLVVLNGGVDSAIMAMTQK
jgi:hypothetical protein